MKLFELIQSNVKHNVKSKGLEQSVRANRYPRDYNDETDHSLLGKIRNRIKNQPNPKLKTIGAGSYAHAFSQDNKPEITKIGRTKRNQPTLDGHMIYLDTIAKNDRMSSNPYFPRVYKRKTYQDGSYSLEMEKLERLQSLELEQILSIGENIFDYWPQDLDELFVDMQSTIGNYYNDLRHKYDSIQGEEGTDENKEFYKKKYLVQLISQYITRRILKVTQKQEKTKIKDAKLLQAIGLLRVIIRKYADRNINLDIHDQNLMARITPYGAQLVFTDPLH